MNNRKKLSDNPTPEQLRCLSLLIELFGGEHHLPTVYEFGNGVRCRQPSMSTYDNDLLTRLVVLAHDHCIRAEISRDSIILHARQRNGEFWQRHQTLETAITAIRKCSTRFD
jgi:hypothetical protein